MTYKAMILCALVAGCGGSESNATSKEVALRLDAVEDDCNPGLQCPAGYVCANLSQYEKNFSNPRCVQGSSPCNALQCPTGQSCAIDEMAPPSPYCSDGNLRARRQASRRPLWPKAPESRLRAFCFLAPSPPSRRVRCRRGGGRSPAFTVPEGVTACRPDRCTDRH